MKARIVSEALANVPQAEDFQLWFSNNYSPTKLRQLTKIRLLQVRYLYRKIDQFTPHYFEEAGFTHPKLLIEIYAVPVEIRERITQLLQDEALPKIHVWLHLRSDVTNQRSCRIEVFYVDTDDILEYFQHQK